MNVTGQAATVQPEEDLPYIRALFAEFVHTHRKELQAYIGTDAYHHRFGVIPLVEQFKNTLDDRVDELAAVCAINRYEVLRQIDLWHSLFYRGEFSDHLYN